MRSVLVAMMVAVSGVCLAGCGHAQRSQPVAGATVFAQDCQVCHSLVGNESLHKQGGDLRGYRMSRQELASFTREMPVRRPLTPADLRAVVNYVLQAQRGSR